MAQTLLELFNARVQKADGCWFWTGSLDKDGYGILKHKGKMLRASRISWELFHGMKLGRRQVRHKCDVRPCVNPDHLLCGTPAQNSSDMVRRGRAATGRRNGAHTHPGQWHRSHLNPRSKLTLEKAAQIRSLRENGETLMHLAIKFGVSKKTILNVVQGTRYAA